jgi:hypothetical protein
MIPEERKLSGLAIDVKLLDITQRAKGRRPPITSPDPPLYSYSGWKASTTLTFPIFM